MDKCSSDADFDSYWEYESKNKNRNRIRVGRQYQASVPPLLKPGERDSRRCEDLETLKWKPDILNDQSVEQYMSMAKAISRFARAIDPSLVPEKIIDTPMQTALKGLSEFVTSHHPCHHDAGCQVPNPQQSGECSTKQFSPSNEWTPLETQLFAQALEVCGKNFCAIKKDFLPWKPVKSLIEYYYQGKSEKSESSPQNTSDSPEDDAVVNKVDELETIASCSHTSPQEVQQPKTETKELSDECVPECKTEVPEETTTPCTDSLKVEENQEMKPADSSTVGSLKFYLGGRLVLKLNAQQYSDSSSKCHWVPSNDTPRRPQLAKRVKNKNKMHQESSATYQVHSNKPENLFESSGVGECDEFIAKKPKLKSDCESSSERGTPCSFLYSTSWTPPVANGPDVVEMDDCSSKTSEGCISPMQVNSVGEAAEIKTEHASSITAGDPNETNEIKPQRLKMDAIPSTFSASQSETSVHDTYIVPSAHLKTEKSAAPNKLWNNCYGTELQISSKCMKNVCSTETNALCFLPPSAVSPSKRQWCRWPASPCAENFESSSKVLSPSSISQTPVPGRTAEDSPLDLSSKIENAPQQNTAATSVPSASMAASSSHEDKICLSPSKEVLSTCTKSNDSNPNVFPSSDSAKADEEAGVRTGGLPCEGGITENCEKCTKNGDNILSLSDKSQDEKNKNSSDFSYPCFDVQCSCSSPKCTTNFALKESMCNKDDFECLKGHSSYLLPVANTTTASGKPPPWFEASVATYLQCYPQCYPYYLAYGVSPPTVTGSSVTELPLDLSSTCENSNEGDNIQRNVPENEAGVAPTSAEALEKGMLYHLLKNRNSK